MSADSVIADLPEVVVRHISVSDLDNNVYLLTSKATGAQILIDAADDAAAIADLLTQAAADSDQATSLAAVITTHAHRDHLRALKQVAGQAMTVAGAADASQIEATTGVAITRPVNHGDTVTAPGLRLEVICLRGHTPGSIALVLEQPGQPVHLFTGDSLFPGGVGNTNYDPARFAQLFADVKQRLFERFGDDTVVHPGHGQPTTLGAERPHLRQWQARGW